MKIKVLGSAAGGGFPQWNCNCSNCTAVRRGDPAFVARTQSSLCVSENGIDWVLINASPDVLHQIGKSPHLQPGRAIRDSGLAGVILTDAQLDHTAGLLMLRERGMPWPLYATPEVWSDLSNGFPLSTTLSHYCGLEPRRIPIDGTAFKVPGLPRTRFVALPIDSAPPPYSPRRGSPASGDNIALLIEHEVTNQSAFYAPGLAHVSDGVRAAMGGADVLLVDGTFWHEDEMRRAGLSEKCAKEMGHLPQCGPGGMLEVVAGLPELVDRVRRTVLIHINNTNPILDANGRERRELERRGIEVGFDGMTFSL